MPDVTRGEVLNYGIVAMPDGQAARVWVEPTAIHRLRALHPDLARWNAEDQTKTLTELLGEQTSSAARDAVMQLTLGAATMSGEPGLLVAHEDEMVDAAWLDAKAEELLDRFVRPPKRALPAPKRAKKNTSRLAVELRTWLKGAKAFSSKIEDLSRNRVVANFPVDLNAELYADFAMMNGRLNVIEVLDLRGVDRLTASQRGEAALKGVTLDEAKDQAHTVAVVAASDYGAAKPAIRMMQRYAGDMYDLGSSEERARFAAFIAKGLHREELDLVPPFSDQA